MCNWKPQETKFSKLVRGRSWKTWDECLDSDTLFLPRTLEAFHDIEVDTKIDYSLPAKNSTSGQVLERTKKLIERVVSALSPAIYKIGFTHDPAFRWNNKTFGYQKAIEKWDGMLVMYAGSNAMVASFVEAAMIQWFLGDLMFLKKNLYIPLPQL